MLHNAHVQPGPREQAGADESNYFSEHLTSLLQAPQSHRGRERANERDFRRIVRHSVSPEDVVEPNGRLRRVLAIPGVPRVYGLRFPGDETPVDPADTSASENRQDALESAPPRTGHVLGAYDRPSATVSLERRHESLDRRAIVVAVKRDDVGAVEHVRCQRVEAI